VNKDDTAAGSGDMILDASPPGLLVVTGASGAGKTTLVRALNAQRRAGVGCYHFDDIGVPSPEEMVRRYGSDVQWQAAATAEWITRLARNDDGVAVAVLDAQVRPRLVLQAVEGTHIRHVRIVLVDCDYGERNARLRGPRGQPELATADMDRWAAYLRGLSDALDLPVLDTTGATIEDAAASLAAHVDALVRQMTE
jgi:hypothetical protein